VNTLLPRDRQPPPAQLTGLVEAGVGNAHVWLSRFNAAYASKLGAPVYPGSLNLRLPRPFDWTQPQLGLPVLRFARAEYGGERDILLLPCRLVSLEGHPAHLWTTTTPRDPSDWQILELLADVSLRTTYGLRDGDPVTLELMP
jgi:CTP-dependent riboflavin kinase